MANTFERIRDAHAPSGGETFRRTIGSPALFTILYASLASAIYFALSVIAEHALGLTPLVFLLGGVFFALTAMTYVEGASLHQDRGGSTVFARYAFNEIVSFVAGWAVLLDYIILVAVSAFSATNYLAAFWAPLGDGTRERLLAFAIVSFVAIGTIRGFSPRRATRVAMIVVADVGVQLLVVIVGLATFFHPGLILDPIQLGHRPQWPDFFFALGIATVVYLGLESASGLAGEVRVTRRGLKRLVSSATIVVVVLYVGIAVVALSALPVVGNETSLSRNYLEAPMLGIADSFRTPWVRDAFTYAIATLGALTLVAAANSAMLGLSRLAYSLATNRQIPSRLGRLHPQLGTPYVLIGIAAVLAAGLVVPLDLELLTGIFAYGSLIGLTIAHLSIIVLRFRDPDRRRPYRIPGNVRVG